MGFPHSSVSNEFACNAGHPGSIPGWEDPLEKEMATHSSILAWRIPWAEEPGRLQSTGLQESDTTWRLNHHQRKNFPRTVSLRILGFLQWMLNCRMHTKPQDARLKEENKARLHPYSVFLHSVYHFDHVIYNYFTYCVYTHTHTSGQARQAPVSHQGSLVVPSGVIY